MSEELRLQDHEEIHETSMALLTKCKNDKKIINTGRTEMSSKERN